MKRMMIVLLALALIGAAIAVAETSFPETRQATGTEVSALENMPVYDYDQREIWLENDGQRIYGIAYVPKTDGAAPLAILSHGLGGNYANCLSEAEQLARHGIAAYCFDFRGGGRSRSDGNTTQMSVMTEVSDLETVLAAAQTWDFVDSARVALMGFSQGGIVSAITAARHVEEVAGLILCYPAFLVSDAVHEQFAALEDVPDEYAFNWVYAGRAYAADMWDYDVYSEIGNYNKPVLLMHGDRDGIVPIAYAERAAEVYPDVEYHVIQGAGHGFMGAAFEESMALSFAYLQRIGLLGSTASNDTLAGTSIRMTFSDGTVGTISDLRDNATTRAFLASLPTEITLQDWDGREYWISETLPYDEDSVRHSYAIGEFTYWCGGWVTAYYDTNEDTVIEAGSDVIGMMDETAVQKFADAGEAEQRVRFEIVER